jgi:2-polyprenyl-3-methyl-5-hydroxy-6-metoxy-1,4-benzoquinol methylase
MTIARDAALSKVVLLEPSKEMIKDVDAKTEIWPIRAEDLQSTKSVSGVNKSRGFDVITCLWNVLGHIRGNEARVGVLAQLGSMLPPQGKIFFDVNHRYNIRSYGFTRTVFRYVGDRLFPRSTNGDVEVTWRLGDEECRTYGHVFTDREVRRLASAAGLIILERIVVDYDTGTIRRFGFQGNLFYVLRRNSSNDSHNASQT